MPKLEFLFSTAGPRFAVAQSISAYENDLDRELMRGTRLLIPQKIPCVIFRVITGYILLTPFSFFSI
jgi:hypothetical protein